MKKLLFGLLWVFLFVSSLSAQNIVLILEEIGSIEKTKSVIYSDTKKIISDNLLEANLIIVKDDSNGSEIVLNGSTVLRIKQSISIYSTYEYQYSAIFRLRENMYNLEIYNVVCTKAFRLGLGDSTKIALIQPFGEKVPKAKFNIKEISKKQKIKLMNNLKAELSRIISQYSKFISATKR